MTIAAPPETDPILFHAALRPHRSLDQRGFGVLLAGVGAVSFVGGALFVAVGAWPVVGFLGLDVALIYWAFRASYRSGSESEEITMTPSQLTVRKAARHGPVREWTLNPLWARLERQIHPEFGLERLWIVSNGRRLPIASFLGARERQNLADEMTAGLQAARRGFTRTGAV